jgi:hypothetical protein
MHKRTFALMVSFLLLLGPSILSAENEAGNPSVLNEYERDDFSFRVLRTEIVPSAGNPKDAEPAPMVLAIDFALENNLPTRKVNLTDNLQFKLLDEFGNSYRRLSPRCIRQGRKIHPPKFPLSLYPNEKFKEFLCFEAPLAASQQLFLWVDASALGLTEPISIPLSREKILGDNWVPAKRPPTEDDLKILFPKEGMTARPGQVVYLRIKFPKDALAPQSLYVVSPQYTFQDNQVTYRYDLRIPKSTKSGPFLIIVLAKWGDLFEDFTVSKSVTLNIVSDLTQKCVENCRDLAGNDPKKLTSDTP